MEKYVWFPSHTNVQLVDSGLVFCIRSMHSEGSEGLASVKPQGLTIGQQSIVSKLAFISEYYFSRIDFTIA